VQARNLDLDVRDAIADISQEIILKRQPKGAYSSQGRWIDQPIEEIKINASVQVASSEDLIGLDEGLRTRETIKIYTTNFVKTGNVEKQTQADVIVWQGKEFEIVKVEDWSVLGGYYSAIAAKRAH